VSGGARRMRTVSGGAAIRTLVSTATDEAVVAAELLAQCADAGPGLVVLFATMSLDLGRLGELLRAGGRETVVGAATGRAIGSRGFLKHGVTGFLLPASRYAVAAALIEKSTRLGAGEAALLVGGLRAELDAGPGAAFRQRFALLLVDAEPRCEEPLTATLGLALSGIPLVGGSAGDLYFNPAGHRPEAARVLAGTRSLPGGAVLLFLAEKRVQGIETVEVNLMAGEHRREPLVELNPLARVPTLVLDDRRVLAESRAICTYLEGLHPEPNLMGRTAEERAFIEMWDRRAELSFMQPLAMWVRHTHPAFPVLESPQLPEYAGTQREAFLRVAQWFDRELSSRDHLAGERFTIADITAFVTLDFARLVRFKAGEAGFPALQRWRDRVAARPAFAA
jgi:glutathione S-transferase